MQGQKATPDLVEGSCPVTSNWFMHFQLMMSRKYGEHATSFEARTSGCC